MDAAKTTSEGNERKNNLKLMKNNEIITKCKLGGSPLSQNEKDETAATISPMNDHSAGEHESIVRPDFSTSESLVTHETGRNLASAEANPPTLPQEDNIPLGKEVNVKVSTSDVDLDSISIDQDFAKLASVKSESAAPSIGKAASQTWFSPHPDQSLWKSFLTIRDQADKSMFYILNPALEADLAGEFSATLLVPCMTRQNDLFFWPIKLPNEDGRIDTWNESALEIALAEGGQWLRLRANQPNSSYDTVTLKKEQQPPEWPEDILELLKKAVGKVHISDLEHPLVKRLRGE